jgi:hypothetical protein
MSFVSTVSTYFAASAVNGTTSVDFATADLPSVSVNPSTNINDVREVVYSILEQFNAGYSALPDTDGGDPTVNAKDPNLTISKTSTIASDNLTDGTTIRTTYTVSFLTSPADVNVVDAV